MNSSSAPTNTKTTRPNVKKRVSKRKARAMTISRITPMTKGIRFSATGTRRAGDDLEPARASHRVVGELVQLDHRHIVSAHDEESRRLHMCECSCGQIGSSAARDDGVDQLRPFRRGDERGTGAGACTKKTD